ncbi:TPR and ankyrin repeat-containing protein 1 [Glycine max]|nr:TPR and ankyrin repeat-containing protein 1 [Glycine max]
MMEGETTSKKKKANDDHGFIDLIFSWSIEDILNEDMYKNKVQKIDLSFQSIDHYVQSYAYPLLEETRAQLCSSMEIIHQAPYTEVIGIKEAKPLQNKLYNLKIDGWKNRFSHHGGEPYRTLPGDVLILADYKPEAVRDLQRIRRLWCFASTVWTTEDEGDSTSLKVKASKDIDLEERRNKTLFLIFLTNVNPNRRIWGALHMPGNLKLLRQILCSRDDVEECCGCSYPSDALRDDCTYQMLLSELNESQNKAISACLSGLNCNHNSAVKLIWGPPGTGKTRTLGTLLYALLKMKYRVLVCAPTNVAIKEVASRVVDIMKEAHSKESGDLFCSMGEVLLFGYNERLKIGEDVEDVYLDHRVQQLTECFSPYNGFSSSLKSMIGFLEYCVSDYHIYVENMKREGSMAKSFLVFLREGFHSIALPLKAFISILCTHVAMSHLLKHNYQNLLCLNEALESFQDLLLKNTLFSERLEKLFSYKKLPVAYQTISWSFDGDAYQLYEKRTACLNALLAVEHSLQDFMLKKSNNSEIREFCFQTSSLIFSTASGSHKLHSLTMKPLNILVIDEAAMLKDCESIIPLLLPGISHALLFGDECQLSSMVRSNDASNVERIDYVKQYLPGPMFGPYSFINVFEGKEQFDDAGRSYKNMAEVAVVMTILKNLFKAWLNSKHKLSIGIVSPYVGQVVAIQEKLGQIYESHDGFNVDVKSIDGFQGGEKDVIILSTVRTNNRTSLEFISSPQRTNVALTRARHCLWILGNERALASNENVWKAIVLDAKNRKCFFDADQDKELGKAILDAKKASNQLDDLLDTNSVLFKSQLWKVHFSDKFLRSFKRIRSEKIKKNVINLLIRLSSGWRPKRFSVDLSCENSSQMLKQFKVESFYVICSIDIVKASRYIQVLKIWNILPLEDIPQLAKRLDKVFKGYTNEYISRCRCKKKDGNIEFPLSWPLSANIQKFKNVHNDANVGEKNANEDGSDDENSGVEDESTLLMKYCSISRDYMLYGLDSLQVDLPYNVTDEQRKIILFPKSTFVLGRSGTGKTTVLITKLIQNEKLHHVAVEEAYGFNNYANLEASKDIVSETERPILRQLFVTLSPGLCQKVQHHVSRLRRSFGDGSTLAASTDKNIPDSFNGVPSNLYPLVITFRTFLLMLDGTLGNSYFERYYNLKGKDLGSRLVELETLILRKEVNYERFDSIYWPHFNTQLCKKMDSYQVFTEIMSHIKGGSRTVEHGKLSREDYCTLSESRASSLSIEIRNMIYDIFQSYEKMKIHYGEFDLGDVVVDVHSRLRNKRYKGDKMNFVYIDEVQDLTMAQIALFKHICRNVEDGFVFCGDTAETVGRGIDFRFEDVRSIFYKMFVLESKSYNDNQRKEKGHISDIFVLGQNFRTNAEVLKLSQSILELLYHFFPHSTDKLKVETSLIDGEAPVVIRSRNNANSILTAFGKSKNNGDNLGRSGTEQVVLVRDNLAKEEVLQVAGKQALVLTILECKGLEFQDVLLYKFFASSPLQRRWGVIYDYMKEQHMVDSRNHANFWRCFDRDSKHNVLCSDLKQLYVAVTRARRRLLIYEDAEEFSGPMFDYWKMKNLVQFQYQD